MIVNEVVIYYGLSSYINNSLFLLFYLHFTQPTFISDSIHPPMDIVALTCCDDQKLSKLVLYDSCRHSSFLVSAFFCDSFFNNFIKSPIIIHTFLLNVPVCGRDYGCWTPLYSYWITTFIKDNIWCLRS